MSAVLVKRRSWEPTPPSWYRRWHEGEQGSRAAVGSLFLTNELLMEEKGSGAPHTLALKRAAISTTATSSECQCTNGWLCQCISFQTQRGLNTAAVRTGYYFTSVCLVRPGDPDKDHKGKTCTTNGSKDNHKRRKEEERILNLLSR